MWDGAASSLSKILQLAPELVHVELLGDNDIIAASIESLSTPIPGVVVGSNFPAPRLQSLQVDLVNGQLTDGIIDGLSKFLVFRNRQPVSNGGRSAIVDRVTWLFVGTRAHYSEKLGI